SVFYRLLYFFFSLLLVYFCSRGTGCFSPFTSPLSLLLVAFSFFLLPAFFRSLSVLFFSFYPFLY
ncbi:hypothetical protein, partial [Serratia quinivorans]|uniref:hypothetical protein n=1 Tax=Serratia quinivorans TaxID=137545 RepID=UPI0034C5DAF7